MAMTRRQTANPVIDVIRDDFDFFDPWGSGMSALGTIADVLHYAGHPVPFEWGYVASGEPEESVAYRDLRDLLHGTPGAFIEGFTADVDDFYRAGRILDRYLNLAALAGRDY